MLQRKSLPEPISQVSLADAYLCTNCEYVTAGAYGCERCGSLQVIPLLPILGAYRQRVHLRVVKRLKPHENFGRFLSGAGPDNWPKPAA